MGADDPQLRQRSATSPRSIYRPRTRRDGAAFGTAPAASEPTCGPLDSIDRELGATARRSTSRTGRAEPTWGPIDSIDHELGATAPRSAPRIGVGERLRAGSAASEPTCGPIDSIDHQLGATARV